MPQPRRFIYTNEYVAILLCPALSLEDLKENKAKDNKKATQILTSSCVILDNLTSICPEYRDHGYVNLGDMRVHVHRLMIT
jgi:hypothetical protein